MSEANIPAAAAALIQQIETATAPAENPEVADTGLDRCPCCNWSLKNMNPPRPGEDDRKEYVRCLLGKRKFSKTFALFDGMVSARFEVLSQEQSQVLGTYLDQITKTEMMQRATEAMQLKVLFYCRKFNDQVFTPVGADQDWKAVYAERFAEYGEDVPVLLTRVLMEFLRIVEQLPSSGFDTNFWKGAGLS